MVVRPGARDLSSPSAVTSTIRGSLLVIVSPETVLPTATGTRAMAPSPSMTSLGSLKTTNGTSSADAVETAPGSGGWRLSQAVAATPMPGRSG